jgi:uncharacterized membrane protein SirB2
MYLTIKYLHITLALISISGFIIRGGLKMMNSPYLQIKWIKITPHIIDTALLCCGVYMAVVLNLALLSTPWLLAKLIALFAYIGLGLVTLRFAKTNKLRLIAYLLAVSCFIYMFQVAITRSIMPF